MVTDAGKSTGLYNLEKDVYLSSLNINFIYYLLFFLLEGKRKKKYFNENIERNI